MGNFLAIGEDPLASTEGSSIDCKLYRLTQASVLSNFNMAQILHLFKGDYRLAIKYYMTVIRHEVFWTFFEAKPDDADALRMPAFKDPRLRVILEATCENLSACYAKTGNDKASFSFRHVCRRH
eukprot:tig00000076_g2436.t1